MIAYMSKPSEKHQKLKTLKCPQCKRGRICDVSFDSETRITQSLINGNYDDIVLKCPKCGAFITISMIPSTAG